MAAAVSDLAHKEKKKKKRSALIHQVQTDASKSSYARVRVTFAKRFCIQMAADKNNRHVFVVEPASPADVSNAEVRNTAKKQNFSEKKKITK